GHLVADGEWSRTGDICGLYQGCRPPDWARRADRPHLGLLPAFVLRHPSSGHGHGFSVRTRREQAFRCPDHRRLGRGDRGDLGLSAGSAVMSVGESATPLGKVRGLGSAREGGEHWLSERVTSIALLLLGVWLIASLLLLPTLDLRTITEWLHAPTGAVPMALLIVIGFKHALDGMKVVVDDYVHEEGDRFTVNILLLFLAVGGGSLALFALARIAFGGTA